MAGSSAGGLLSLLSACGVQPAAAVQRAHELCTQRGVFARPLGLLGVWGGLVRDWLHELLPADAAERCCGRVTLVVTPLPWLAPTAISNFKDKADLIDVALASAHVPFVMDGSLAGTCRGRPCVDGSINYILLRRKAGLVPPGAQHRSLIFDPWADRQLRSSWSWQQCVELLSLAGALRLMQLGEQHAAHLHAAGKLALLQPLAAPTPAPAPAPAPAHVPSPEHLLVPGLDGTLGAQKSAAAKGAKALCGGAVPGPAAGPGCWLDAVCLVEDGLRGGAEGGVQEGVAGLGLRQRSPWAGAEAVPLAA